MSVTAAIAEARARLERRLWREAGWPLLEAWRDTRAPALADALDRLLALQAAHAEIVVPTVPYLAGGPDHWRALSSHPFFEAEPPDPRATLPLIAAHFTRSSWHERAAARLLAHGDRRAGGWLERACVGAFPSERRALVAALPRPRALPDDAEHALVALELQLKDAVATLRAHVGTPTMFGLDAAQRAVLLTVGCGDLALFVQAPVFDGAELVEAHVRANVAVLDALCTHPHAPRFRRLSFFDTAGWEHATAPTWWTRPWQGAAMRRAAIALLDAQPELLAVGSLPLPLVTELNGGARNWQSLSLNVARDASPDAWHAAFVALTLPALRTLDVNVDTPAPLARALGLLRMTTLITGGGPAEADAWRRALPPSVETLRMESRTWRLSFTRHGAAWALDAELQMQWDSYEPIAEDAPEPGRALCDWLLQVDPDALCALTVKGAGELEGYDAIVAAAKRQRGLRTIALSDVDTDALYSIPLDAQSLDTNSLNAKSR